MHPFPGVDCRAFIPFTTGRDYDFDSDADGQDFLVWQQQPYDLCAPLSVPEPSSLLLAVACVFVFFFRRASDG